MRYKSGNTTPHEIERSPIAQEWIIRVLSESDKSFLVIPWIESSVRLAKCHVKLHFEDAILWPRGQGLSDNVGSNSNAAFELLLLKYILLDLCKFPLVGKTALLEQTCSGLNMYC